MDIRKQLKRQKVLADGAFGTYYATKERKEKIAERANLTDPGLVEQIHLEYLDAGARLLRTNTFAANRQTLQCSGSEQREILKAAVKLARKAAGTIADDVCIAGDIGPVPEDISREPEDLLQEYRDICDVFIEEQVDVIIFETFADLKYVQPVAAYIKEQADVPVIVQFSVNRYGYTKSGAGAARLFAAVEKSDWIDGTGLNCGIGAGHLSQVLKQIELPVGKFLTAFPNSGYPELHQDRAVYLNNHQYFARKMNEIASYGIHILGGCCGTTPEYIADTKRVLDTTAPAAVRVRDQREQEPVRTADICTNTFYQKMRDGKKVLAVELDPPYDAKSERIMECANILHAADVDMITFADSPMGRGRVDSILMGTKVHYETGAAVMPHIACRDKNAIALRAGILGGYMNHIRNLLIVTGDPIQGHDVKSVFDFNSIKLMEFLKQMNLEHFAEEPIYYGGALNQGRRNIDSEMKRMEKKIVAGASYFLTQPIYSEEDVYRIHYIKERLDTKILCGIMPLISYRNAAFIQNEITGIHVPDAVMEQFHPEMSRSEGEATGVAICAGIMRQLYDVADGYYFMIPFNRVHLAEQCVKESKLTL